MTQYGSQNHNSKLTEEMVKAIRRAYARTKSLPLNSKTRNTQAYLASQYGIGRTVVGQILRGERWKHVVVERPEAGGVEGGECGTTP